MFFTTVIILLIAQRFYELRIAKRNTRILLGKGGVEFGAKHYWVMILLHGLFFISMVLEAFIRGIHFPFYWPLLLLIFLSAQAARVWIIRTMNGRWTTRILVIPHESLVSHGPYRFVRHPNYSVVVIEILVFPRIFGLTHTALIFTVLNALVLLLIRLPEERKALLWSQQF